MVAFFTVRRTTFFDAFARVAFFAGFLVAFFAGFLFAAFFAGCLTVRLVAFFTLFFAFFFFVAIWFSAEGSCRYRLLEATA